MGFLRLPYLSVAVSRAAGGPDGWQALPDAVTDPTHDAIIRGRRGSRLCRIGDRAGARSPLTWREAQHGCYAGATQGGGATACVSSCRDAGLAGTARNADL